MQQAAQTGINRSGAEDQDQSAGIFIRAVSFFQSTGQTAANIEFKYSPKLTLTTTRLPGIGDEIDTLVVAVVIVRHDIPSEKIELIVMAVSAWTETLRKKQQKQNGP